LVLTGPSYGRESFEYRNAPFILACAKPIIWAR
jgi:hypothetical protein